MIMIGGLKNWKKTLKKCKNNCKKLNETNNICVFLVIFYFV